MLASLFKAKPLLEEETIQWLFDGFAWALKNFGSDVFYNETILVEPSNKCFPEQGNSVDEMANLIFKRVKHYAGLDYWPTRVMNHHEFDAGPESLANIHQALQNQQGAAATQLTLFYEPQQVGNPDAMIANYAHALAHHLSALAQYQAPCATEHWPQMMELVAVYMGFGIMFVNSAVPQRQTCGSCCSPAMSRQGALTEMEVIYALAIFCALKEIPAKEVVPHIKGYLKPLMKKALKDAQGRTAMLAELKAINAASPQRGAAISQQWQARLGSAQ